MGFVFAALASMALVVSPVAGAEPRHVGAERCKLCHRSIYEAWTATAHRRAWESVSPPDALRGCLRCHATGPDAFPGVECEACHGAGGEYWPAEIMMDPRKAREAGLVEQTESVCRNCHGSGLPGHSSEFSMPAKADWRRAVH